MSPASYFPSAPNGAPISGLRHESSIKSFFSKVKSARWSGKHRPNPFKAAFASIIGKLSVNVTPVRPPSDANISATHMLPLPSSGEFLCSNSLSSTAEDHPWSQLLVKSGAIPSGKQRAQPSAILATPMPYFASLSTPSLHRRCHSMIIKTPPFPVSENLVMSLKRAHTIHSESCDTTLCPKGCLSGATSQSDRRVFLF